MRQLALIALFVCASVATAAAPRGPFGVGGDVKPPVLLRSVDPVYPPEARQARVSGSVVVEALIDKRGNVRDVVILKPLPFSLDRAAADAVKQWKFKPATLKGRRVDVLFRVTVNFNLE